MYKASRKSFLQKTAVVVAAAGFVRYPADAAEFEFKLAMDAPVDHHMTRNLNLAASKIKSETSGQLDIQVFPNNMLGSSTSQIVQVRSNVVQIVTSADFVLADVVPVAGITSTPFVFANVKEAQATMTGPLGKFRREAIAKIGVHPFERSWHSGFRQMVNSVRPIAAPDDLKGLKMRIPVSPVLNALFKAFGSSPTPINANEMYVALQTHLADGLELPMASIESYKMYEVQKYVSYTNHIWTSTTLLCNADAWQSLPPKVRDTLERNIDLAGMLDEAEVGRLETTLEGTLKGQGMLFNAADIPAFRNVVKRAGLYGQWRETYGSDAWAMLEKSVGKLT